MPVVARASRESLSSIADYFTMKGGRREHGGRRFHGFTSSSSSVGEGSSVGEEEDDVEMAELANALQRAGGAVAAANAEIAEIQEEMRAKGTMTEDEARDFQARLDAAGRKANEAQAAANAMRERHAAAADRRRAQSAAKGILGKVGEV